MKIGHLLNERGICLALLTVCATATPAFAAGSEQIDGFRDTPMLPGTKWHLHDPDRPQPPVVGPGATFSQGAPAPSDAEVLFDGKDLSKWQTARGQDAPWVIKDGYMETAAQQGILTQGSGPIFSCTSSSPPLHRPKAPARAGVTAAF